jgi:SAM-dependent methyltransferase
MRYQHVIGRYARGAVLDIGYAKIPNPHLQNAVGLDRLPAGCPANYAAALGGDAHDLPFRTGVFDSVVASEVIEHLENPSRFLAECRRVLRKNGVLCISTPNPYYPPVVVLEVLMIKKGYFDDDHVNLFPPRIMLKLLRKERFLLERIESGGGIYLPGRRRLAIPFFKGLAQDLVYICKKEK